MSKFLSVRSVFALVCLACLAVMAVECGRAVSQTPPLDNYPRPPAVPSESFFREVVDAVKELSAVVKLLTSGAKITWDIGPNALAAVFFASASVFLSVVVYRRPNPWPAP